MRFLRSIVFAGLALAAMAVCAAMPAAASVPIDPGIHVMAQNKAVYPAPAINVAMAITGIGLTPKPPTISYDPVSRRPFIAASLPVAHSPFSSPAYMHIDPDIAA